MYENEVFRKKNLPKKDEIHEKSALYYKLRYYTPKAFMIYMPTGHPAQLRQRNWRVNDAHGIWLWKARKAYKISVEEILGKRPLGRTRRKYNNIRVNLIDTSFKARRWLNWVMVVWNDDILLLQLVGWLRVVTTRSYCEFRDWKGYS